MLNIVVHMKRKNPKNSPFYFLRCVGEVERTESVGEVKIMRMQEMLQVETLDESQIPESPPSPSTTPAPAPTAEEEKDLVPTVWVDEAGNESEVRGLDPMLRIRIRDPVHF